MRKIVLILPFILGLLICACTSEPGQKKKLTVPQLFTDHMVLQQKQEVAFWGVATPKQKVEVSASWGNKATAVADDNGGWKLQLKTPAAGGPYDIQITSTSDSIAVKDVLIGEVWLASGQSNMEMPLSGWFPRDTIINSAEEIAHSDFPEIRFMKIDHNTAAVPLDSVGGKWQLVSPKTAGDFSAAAYYYARKLNDELHVPIGIIQSVVGGTPAEAWTSAEALEQLNGFKGSITELKTIAKSKKGWFEKFQSKSIPTSNEGWDDISFADEKAPMPEYDDSNWDSLSLPGRIDQLKNGEFDGAIWLRKTFTITDEPTDYQLDIASIDDMDATYINGKKVGGLVGAGHANAPRSMQVPKALLKKGSNTVAIRVIDTGGPGSIMGSIVLSNSNGAKISLAGTWKSRQVSEIVDNKFYSYGLQQDLSGRPNLSQYNTNSPTVLFNAMINPLVPYTLKGVIWYQGETNVGRAEQYKSLFPAMIKDWRNRWKSDFPFNFVQLAPFDYGGDQSEKSQMLRNAQRLALKTTNTDMAITLDIGSLQTIHPPYKKEVGDRLARIALADQYGRDMVSTGPLFKKAQASGNKLIVEFDNVGNGLTSPDSKLSGFEIAGEDKDFLPATAVIKDNKVVVSNPEISKPVYVRYAWSDGSTASLFNTAGLPAATFTSED